MRFAFFILMAIAQLSCASGSSSKSPHAEKIPRITLLSPSELDRVSGKVVVIEATLSELPKIGCGFYLLREGSRHGIIFLPVDAVAASPLFGTTVEAEGRLVKVSDAAKHAEFVRQQREEEKSTDNTFLFGSGTNFVDNPYVDDVWKLEGGFIRKP